VHTSSLLEGAFAGGGSFGGRKVGTNSTWLYRALNDCKHACMHVHRLKISVHALLMGSQRQVRKKWSN
jgi:hypothetical protein